MSEPVLKAPYPYPGGKATVADMIWERLGNVDNFIEPFAGSLASLLRRPAEHFKNGYRVETMNDANHYVCLAPGTRILRSDLSWSKAGDVRVGDVLIGFDEFNVERRPGSRLPNQYRRWRQTAVTAVARTMKPCYRLTFEEGTVVVASADHQWLSGSKDSGGCSWHWRTTEDLGCGVKRSRVLKLCDAVEREESWEAGWLGGLLDGEGSVAAKAGWRLCLAQNPGITLERAERYLAARSFKFSRLDRESGCSVLLLGGGMREVLRLLMTVRPERLIKNAVDKIDRFSLYGRKHHSVALVSKEFLGEQEVVAIETDRHTFIAEGLASHNCNFWRCLAQQKAEEVAAYADWPVMEADLHARHRWLVRSDESHGWRTQFAHDPHFCDPKIAGWWVWGQCCWICSGWCGEGVADHEQRPIISGLEGQTGRGVNGGCDSESVPKIGHGSNVGNAVAGTHVNGDHTKRGRPQLADAFDIGRGVNSNGGLQVPLLRGDAGCTGTGVTSTAKRPNFSFNNLGCGVNSNGPAILPGGGTCAARREWLIDWMKRLADRLRLVRTCYGHWARVCDSDSTLTRLGLTGVLLDPPYPLVQKVSGKKSRAGNLYATDQGADLCALRDEVLDWCRRWGQDPNIRVALCCYEGDGYEPLAGEGWGMESWEANGGYGNQAGNGKAENAKRERIYFSPACIVAADLFSGIAT